ncbi:MAG TPA: hypothetical protein VN429_07455 [Methanospirillum sp.]|uniref:hypothetical protein n=1 Tax=Methanospirillum sp. TaxID=45200 RepID=UPI002C0F6C6A|nr:hypothetical protein [Methanospirillum sp.]HWQ64237.1 hypothetical protein [Methanospirillum sp.]
MKRPNTERCTSKRCPHLIWQWYRTSGPITKDRRRCICVLMDRQPGNMDYCPIEEEAGVPGG